jgi:hypothetical protein
VSFNADMPAKCMHQIPNPPREQAITKRIVLLFSNFDRLFSAVLSLNCSHKQIVIYEPTNEIPMDKQMILKSNWQRTETPIETEQAKTNK